MSCVNRVAAARGDAARPPSSRTTTGHPLLATDSLGYFPSTSSLLELACVVSCAKSSCSSFTLARHAIQPGGCHSHRCESCVAITRAECVAARARFDHTILDLKKPPPAAFLVAARRSDGLLWCREYLVRVLHPVSHDDSFSFSLLGLETATL
jgi:hypothetical protein